MAAVTPVLTHLDLQGVAELQNALVQNLAVAPSSPSPGRIYYDTALSKLRYWDGSAWQSPATETFTLAVHNATDHTAVAGTIHLDALAAPQANVAMAGYRLTGVGNPLNPQDAATKSYVDGVSSGLTKKTAAKAIAAGNVAITTPGTTAFDGYVPNNGDLLLLIGQTTASQNGLWTFNGANAALTRPASFATGSQAEGTYVFIEGGTVYKDAGFVLDGTNIVVDTTAETWVQFSGAGEITAGNGLSKTGNTLSVLAADGSLTTSGAGVTVGNVPVNKGGTGATTATGARTNLGATGTYAQSIGDGTALTYTVTHNLNNRSCLVQVVDVATYTTVLANVTRTDANNCTVTFLTAPTSNQYRVVVVG